MPLSRALAQNIVETENSIYKQKIPPQKCLLKYAQGEYKSPQ